MIRRHKHSRALACGALVSAVTWCGPLDAEESKLAVAATAGAAFGRRSVEFALVEARAALRPHLSVASAIAYLSAENGYREWQLRAFATATLRVGPWVVDDRNMVYVSSESVERYRNRLRATFPAFLGRPRWNAHLFDELYFDFDRDQIVRNNVGTGFSVAISRCCRVELDHLWSDDRGTRETRYWLAHVTMTVR